MLKQILEFLASDVGRNILTSLAAVLTIIASVYAFLRWVKYRYPSDRRVRKGTGGSIGRVGEAVTAPDNDPLKSMSTGDLMKMLADLRAKRSQTSSERSETPEPTYEEMLEKARTMSPADLLKRIRELEAKKKRGPLE